MSLNYVTLILDGFTAGSGALGQGAVTFTPSIQLSDPTDHEWIPPALVQAYFRQGLASPQVSLLATDNANVLPAGWGWVVSFQNVPGNPASFSFFLPFSGGATQYLSAQQPTQSVVTMAAYMPLPTGTPQAGQVPIATGNGEASAWGAQSGGGSLPLTTLGDTVYENSTPAPARLPGNTSATKNFLTQTGTGSVSAAPAWGTIAAGDVPTLNQNTTGTAANITATLDQVPAPAANVSLNSKKITSLANGSAASDAAAFGQIPAALPPNGAASGDLGGSYPSPTVTATHLASALPVPQGGTGSTTRNFAGLLTPTAVKTGAYTAAAGDYVPCDTTTAGFTVTLPAAPADLTVIGVKMVIQGAANTVTIAAAGADVFNKASGPTSLTLTLLNQGAILQYKASSAIWYVFADDLALAQLDSRYVASVTAADTSVVVGGTPAAPTVATGTLDVIASVHPPAANWSNNSKKITSLANGSAASDAAAFGQIPVIDSTTGDIAAAPGTAAAGATGKAADAGHVHPQPTVFAPTGLTGAVQASRYAGATASGAPASGTFAVGDYVVDQTGKMWVCTTAGSPGTWTQVGSGGSLPLTTLGDTLYENSTPTPTRLPGNTSATKNFLTQTGTGSVSAAPAWGAIASGDLPTGTTSAQGALQLDGTIGDIQPLGTQAAGSSGLAADAKHVHPDELIWTPADHGLIAWSFDPAGVTAGFLVIGGTVYLIGIKLRYTKTITNVLVIVTAAGATLTANECFAGLYNSSGTLLSATADQSGVWNSTGNKTMALATQQTNLAAGLYWVALVANGTTEPTFGRAASFSVSAPNLGLAAASSRYATNGTGQISLPASITPSSNAQSQNVIWAGAS